MVLWLAALWPASAAEPLRIGSKRFTESYILGELLTQSAAGAGGTAAEHLQGLGNTAIVLAALRAGKIDLYPEYLGTIDLEILRHAGSTSLEQMRRELAPLGLGVGLALGFNNSYALAMRAGPASVASVSELAALPALRFGLSHEFLGRADGWPGLARRYGLAQRPLGLDHGLAYQALAGGQVDVIDIYTTDARIGQYGLRVLADDLHYFPRYDAVLLYRLDVPARFPAAWRALAALEGRISSADMSAMNAAAEIGGQSFAAVARGWLAAHHPVAGAPAPVAAPAGLLERIFDGKLWQLTRQHLTLVALAVAAACLLGIPLGMLAAHAPRLRQAVLALAGLLQTLPSLALLALLIPVLGIGIRPALVALFVYALLPIVRNTCTGLLQLPAGLLLAGRPAAGRPGAGPARQPAFVAD